MNNTALGREELEAEIEKLTTAFKDEMAQKHELIRALGANDIEEAKEKISKQAQEISTLQSQLKFCLDSIQAAYVNNWREKYLRVLVYDCMNGIESPKAEKAEKEGCQCGADCEATVKGTCARCEETLSSDRNGEG